jgi:hypothetical protein
MEDGQSWTINVKQSNGTIDTFQIDPNAGVETLRTMIREKSGIEED